MANNGDRGRTFELTCFNDNPRFYEVVRLVKETADSAYVYHDKDVWDEASIQEWENENGSCPFVVGEVKIPHIHAVIRFPNARYLDAVKRDYGITSVRKCQSLRGMLRYLTHMDYEDKFQYGPELVHCYGKMNEAFKKAIQDEVDLTIRVLQLSNYIDSFDCYLTRSVFLREVCNADLLTTVIQLKGWAYALLDEHNAKYVDYKELSNHGN